MLSCSIWFSAPSFWMGGGLESRYVGRVYGADGAVHLVLSSKVLYLCIENQVKTRVITNAIEVCNHCAPYVLYRSQSVA